jgi:hypothetical protein
LVGLTADNASQLELATEGQEMHRIGVVLTAILLLLVVAMGAVLLMGWPVQDKLFYFSVGWVLGWLACYLAARVVVWIIARWVRDDPKSN